MSGTGRITAATVLLPLGLGWLIAVPASSAEEEPNEALIQMIVELVSDSDRDMRALGLQQVREEVPGEAATKTFAELLPKLPPDAQAGLIEALGDRGDASARQVVLDSLESDQEAIRAAAIRALGALGTSAEVPALAQKAAAGSDLERSAARQALIRLRGDEVNQKIVAAMDAGEPALRAELLGVVAARNAKEALPGVLKSAGDPDQSVRLAALDALRYLAAEENTAAVIDVLKAAKDDAEQTKAELALLAVCSRGREACVDAILAGLEGAEAPSRIPLLHALARAGGPKALEAIARQRGDDDEAVRDEAVRMLSRWPDSSATPHLLQTAKTSESQRHQVLAIRGLVRLAGPQEDKPADVETLAEVMGLAKRPQEKRLVVSVLGSAATPESLGLVAPLLGDSAVAEEAGLAAVMIAERIQEGSQDEVRAAMQKVLRYAARDDTRQRAQKVLDSL